MCMTPYRTAIGARDSSHALNSLPKVQEFRAVSTASQTARLGANSFAHVLALLLLWLGADLFIISPALSQSLAEARPENANSSQYGTGWVCDSGYKKEGERCAELFVPEHAYPTNRQYDKGWACIHGYKDIGDGTCVNVAVPDHAYLTAAGNSWECARGYKRNNLFCEKIILTQYAYLTQDRFGSGWDCERGYQPAGNKCTAIEVPSNAFLNHSSIGKPWTCERGYVENGAQCNSIVVPENGYMVDAAYGNGWKCERGFTEIGGRCTQIELPDNAHLDRSGERWACHDNFKRTGNACVAKN